MSQFFRRLVAPFRGRRAPGRSPWTTAGLKARLLLEGMENRVVPSAPAAPPGFTSTTTNYANTVPVTIVDNATVMSTITVTGANAFLHDVDLLTNISHTWNADMRISLSSPSGTHVTIWGEEGGSNDNLLLGTRFDDDGDPGNGVPFSANTFAASNLVSDTTYVNAVARPLLVSREPLAAFRGENPNGTWTLRIQDTATGDSGPFTWSLDLTTLDFASPLAAPAPFTTSPALAIPNTVGVVTSTITVSGQPTYLGQLTMLTNLTHAAVTNLDITLTSPAGTIVTVSTDNGNGANNFNGTLWTDYADPGNVAPFSAATFAASNVVNQTAYTAGTAKATLTPEEAFGAFIGEDPNGVWTLSISTDTAGSVGNLASWTLNLRAPSPIGIPSASGSSLNVTTIGTTTQTVTVVYSDSTGSSPGINVSTIDVNDLVITGPGGPLSAASVSVSPSGNGTPRTATYTFNAPGGTWDFAENGTYTVTLVAGQVADISGNFVPNAPLTTFSVAVPLVLTVTTVADAGAGSLRDAINQANGSTGAAFIQFDATLFSTPRTIALSTGALTITDTLTINSPGAGLVTVNANSTSQVFAVTTVTDVTIDGLTITGGSGGNGSAIGVSAAGANLTVRNSVLTGNGGGTSGGIFMPSGAGLLTVQSTTISGNVGGTGGIYFFSGGSLLVRNSTLSGNTGTSTAGFHGGAVVFYGAVGGSGVVIENSTIHGNSTASTVGGGGVNFANLSGTATVRNSTITGNTAPAAATGGGGIGGYGTGSINLHNSIVAQNSGPATSPDILRASGTVVGNSSLVGVLPSSGFGGTGNLTGTTAAPLNPQLGPLQLNGGPTQTRLPNAGSPVIDMGNNALVGTLTTDQRGVGGLRIYSSAGAPRVDIGATELQPLPPILTIAGGTVTYTENAAAMNLEPTLTVFDLDSTFIGAATVQITAGLDVANDVLAFTPVGSITGVYTAATGTLLLTGDDTLANYQLALRSVTFISNGDNPTPGNRTIAFTATDSPSGNVSAAVTKTVTVVAVNDAPAFGAVNTATQTVLDTGTIAPFATVTVTDPDSTPVTVTLTYTAANGVFTNLGGFTGSAGSYTFSGSPGAAQTALRGLVFDPNEAAIFIGSPVTTTFTLTVSDGVAPVVTNNQTTVQAVNLNDAPSFTAAALASVNEDSGTVTVSGFITSFTAGPANESGQTVVGYQIQNVSVPALFATAPAVSAGGVLTYTLAADANGSSTFQVRVQDNGGVAGGGVDVSVWQTFTITVNPVNDEPSFTAVSPAAVNEDAGAQSVPTFVTVFSAGPANESAQSAMAYEIRNVSNPSLFTAAPAVSPTGVLTFTPAPDANGSSTFQVRVRDTGGIALGGSDVSPWQTYSITVNPVNDAPSFTAASSTLSNTEDDGAFSLPGFANVSSFGPANESGQSVAAFETEVLTGAALFATAPAVGTAGTLTYTLAADANGTATFRVRLRDTGGVAFGGTDVSPWQTITLDVTATNDNPVNTALTNSAVAVGAATLLTGLSVTEPADNVPGATAGYSTTVSVPFGAGVFTGTGFTAGTGTNSITVSGTLAAVNAALVTLSYEPLANAPSVDITVVTDDGGNTGGGALGDTDTFTLVIKVRPVITLSGTTTTFTEDAGPVLVDPFLTITDDDSSDLSKAVVKLATVYPGDVLSFTGALPSGVGADTSVPGQITFTGTAPISEYVALLRTVAFDNPNQDVDPTTRSVVFQVTDDPSTSLDSAPVAQPVAVIDLNDAPRLTIAVGTPSVFEEGTVGVAGVSVADDDVGSNDILLSFSSTRGTFTASGAGVTINGLGTGSLTIQGPIGSVNAALGSVRFTGALDLNGPATVTVAADDLGSTGDPGPLSDSGTFTVVVNAVNDAPSFTPGANVVVNEDSGATTLAWATNIRKGPADESGQMVQFLISNNLPGVFTAQPAVDASGNLTFSVRTDAVGTATVTLRLQDNGGTANGGLNQSNPAVTFTITLAPVNDTPSFTSGGNIEVTEDSGPRTFDGWAGRISTGPVDEVAQTVQFLVTADDPTLFAVQPAVNPNGTLTFTPKADANGVTTVRVRIKDSGGGTTDTSAEQAFTLTLIPLNDPPQFVISQPAIAAGPGTAPVSLPNFVTNIKTGPPDEVGQTVQFEVTNNGEVLFSTQPAISPTGTLTFTPAPFRSGIATVTVRLRDNGGDTFGVDVTPPVQTFTINLTGSNSPPSFTLISGANQSVAEDSGPQTLAGLATNISAGLPSEASQTLTFLVGANLQSLFSVQPAISPTGTLTYTPAPDAVGTATVTVRLMDSGGTQFGGIDTSGPQTFTITLTPVNDAPVFTIPTAPIPADPANGPRTVTNFATGIAAGPANEAGQSVAFLVNTTVGGGLFTALPAIDPLTGTLTFTPAAGATGTATVTVRLQDNGTPVGTSAAQTFTINVAAGAQNSPPTAGPDAITVAANSTPTVVPVLTNDSFAPDTGETLSVTAVGSAAHGTVTLAGGVVSYAPTAGYSGGDSFTYTLSDGRGGTATGTVSVTVTPPPPVVPTPPPSKGTPDLVAVSDQTGSRVRVVNVTTGDVVADITAFPGFQGGTTSTVADVTGDGTPDIIVGAGVGGGPVVKVYDGKTFREVASFHAFLPTLRGGVHVAAADVNGDGVPDLVLGAGAGGGPHVKVVDGTKIGQRDRDNLPTGLLGSFFAYAGDFLGGVSVAAADTDGDGKAEVITGAGPGGSPHVKVFAGGTLQEILSVIPYNADFRGGVNVGAGDLDGDGRAEIITGAGATGGPHVGIYDGLTAKSKSQFFAFPPDDTSGVTVAVRPLSAGGATLVVASGRGEVKTLTAGVVDELLDGAIFGGVAVG